MAELADKAGLVDAVFASLDSVEEIGVKT